MIEVVTRDQFMRTKSPNDVETSIGFGGQTDSYLVIDAGRLLGESPLTPHVCHLLACYSREDALTYTYSIAI
jgi:hypothetical protein